MQPRWHYESECFFYLCQSVKLVKERAVKDVVFMYEQPVKLPAEWVRYDRYFLVTFATESDGIDFFVTGLEYFCPLYYKFHSKVCNVPYAVKKLGR